MNKTILWIFTVVLSVTVTGISHAGDYHKGSTHEGHQGIDLEDSKSKMQDTMKDFIASESQDGVLTLEEKISGKERNLSFMNLHSSVGMKNGKHFSCADFKDVDTGEIVDVDLFVDIGENNELEVSEAVIHKVNGKYVDGSDNVKKESEKGSPKGSGY